MAIVLGRPGVDRLSQVVGALREWQYDGAPWQLHPGDLGWFWRFGAEATAAAIRAWSRDGQILAVGLLDGPRLLRLTTAPEARRDEELTYALAPRTNDRAHTRRSRPMEVRWMKHLGILAHSVEGAMLCMRTFCQDGFNELGPHMHPRVTLDCIAMGHSMAAWDAADYPPIRSILADSVTSLHAAGADFFACPDNTAHIALESVGPELPLPGLHIAEVVADRAARDRRRTVGILGTKYTMDNDVYPAAFRRRGIASAVPDSDERAVVNEIIFTELVEGRFTDEARAAYVDVIKNLQSRGCDAVALVCTEIPLLIDDDSSPLPILDSTRLLAHAAFEVSAGRRGLPTWRGGPATGKSADV